MALFGKLFGGKAKDAVNKFSGNKDYLEGLCAICAITAASEGGIDDAEYEKTLSVIKANKALAGAFGSAEIEQQFGKLSPKTATRSGRAELKQEIQDVLARDKTGEMGRSLMLAALDIADEGGISEKEMQTLEELGKLCMVDVKKLLAE